MKILEAVKKKIGGLKEELEEHSHVKKDRSEYTVGAILREYEHLYWKKYGMTRHQAEVVGRLRVCRTGALGGRIEVGQECGAYQFWYNSHY